MKYELLVFDMDGTILDTLEDLKNSMNYTLRLYNMPERTLDEIRAFVGNGIRRLIEQAVVAGTSDEQITVIHKDFMKYYEVHCADDTKPYEGIIDAIRHLRSLGYKTAVVSNKADYAVKSLDFYMERDLKNFICTAGQGVDIVLRDPDPLCKFSFRYVLLSNDFV